MARHTASVCKLCRREGMKLFLKSTRCDTPKCSFERREYGPGMHTRPKGKPSAYAVRLREKQKLKRYYGVFERQFRRMFGIAVRTEGNTGESLLALLERRLDNVVCRMGLAGSRAEARQMITHGHITINGRRLDIPSYMVRLGDTIGVKNRPKSLNLVRSKLGDSSPTIPDFLEMAGQDPPQARVARLPMASDCSVPVDVQLIVELCSA